MPTHLKMHLRRSFFPLVWKIRMQFSIRFLLFTLTILSMLFALFLAGYKYASGKAVVQELDCGNGRTIRISTERFPEYGKGIYYDVVEQGVIVVPCTLFDTLPPNESTETLTYVLLSPGVSDLIGVVRSSSRSEVLVMHDFGRNRSWPRQDHLQWDLSLTTEENQKLYSEDRRLMEETLWQQMR